MVRNLTLNDSVDLDLHFINEKVLDLEKILFKNEFHNEEGFKTWVNDFKRIYGNRHANSQLYIAFSLLYFLGLVFFNKQISKNEGSLLYGKNSLSQFEKLEKQIKDNYENLKIIDFNYFDPIISCSKKEDINSFYKLINDLSNHIFNLKIESEYIFDYLIQKIISPIIRHKSGEYYTPPFLVKKMVDEAYKFGETVLDPCCGSGNFLVEIVKNILSQEKTRKEKIEALNNIYGYDINPISIYLSKINLLFLLKEELSTIKFNLDVFDSLLQDDRKMNEKFDLIIGNPPWYTYRDIDSAEYQEKIKSLAEKLKIKPLPKNILNLEISTLFFFKANKSYMKDNAKIFFVITKGVITGSHTSRFRNFHGFSDIKIWMFEKKIEKIFNIDFICLFGKKSKTLGINSNQEIPTYHFMLKNDNTNVNYFNKIELNLKKIEILVPFSIEKKGGRIYTKKLISKEKLSLLLPIKESYYKSLFHKGADLNPRNLIFIKFKEVGNSLVEINPDDRILKKAKYPWNNKEFKTEIIEKEFLFKAIKSTELVKFYVYDCYDVFLPLSKYDLSFNYDRLPKNSKKFYDKINNLYINYKKETTKHENLMENLNRWSKLINRRQLSKIKVVYNNSGSMLNSAVIQGDFLITGDLSFYDTDTLNEAYYLSAILNSNMLTEQIKIMKSSRHIFKLPLDLPIQRYDSRNINHQRLSELGIRGQEISRKTINTSLDTNNGIISKIKIQMVLRKKLKSILTQIDDLLIKELKRS